MVPHNFQSTSESMAEMQAYVRDMDRRIRSDAQRLHIQMLAGEKAQATPMAGLSRRTPTPPPPAVQQPGAGGSGAALDSDGRDTNADAATAAAGKKKEKKGKETAGKAHPSSSTAPRKAPAAPFGPAAALDQSKTLAGAASGAQRHPGVPFGDPSLPHLRNAPHTTVAAAASGPSQQSPAGPSQPPRLHTGTRLGKGGSTLSQPVSRLLPVSAGRGMRCVPVNSILSSRCHYLKLYLGNITFATSPAVAGSSTTCAYRRLADTLFARSTVPCKGDVRLHASWL
jgi:hypothetical protein